MPVAFSVFYGDYGGEASIDFLVNRFGGLTIVIAIMHVEPLDQDGHDPVAEMLASFH